MKAFKKGMLYVSVVLTCLIVTGLIFLDAVKKKIPDKLYIYTQDNAAFLMDIPVVGTEHFIITNRLIVIIIIEGINFASNDLALLVEPFDFYGWPLWI